jgi:hypothetical protein
MNLKKWIGAIQHGLMNLVTLAFMIRCVIGR